jgi:predicted DsbA family dithiol-disulfide isomerase
MQIEVWSDVVCPWCWIGKRRLAKAVADLAPAPEIVWRPFQLNPELPAEGMDRAAYRRTKFGSLERSRELEARVAEAGRPEGIDFAFDRIKRTPNTFDAHRVLRRAAREGLQDAVGESLFRAYFAEGRDLGDRAVLEELARAAGLDVRQLWTGDAESAEVRREEAEGRELGIQSVPTFVIDRKLGLSGAQPPSVLRDAIREAASRA